MLINTVFARGRYRVNNFNLAQVIDEKINRFVGTVISWLT